MKLTDATVRALEKPVGRPVRVPDGKGLYIEVRPSGAKFWRYRYKIGGKENMLALGEYRADRRHGHMGLDAARNARAEARELVKRGIHPAQQRKVERASRIVTGGETFKLIAEEWLANQAQAWTPGRVTRVRRWFERDVYPSFGSLPIKTVTPALVLEALRKVEKGSGRGKMPAPTVAVLLLEHVGRVFRLAVSTLRAETDPTYALRGAFKRPRVVHHKPLAPSRFPDLMGGIETYRGDPATPIALKLLLLTFARPGELRAAEWAEFDFDQALWRPAAEKMKMRDPHLVPLSRQVVALLRKLQAISGHRQYLFPNHRRPKSFMSPSTLNNALNAIGFKGEFTPHGVRATGSTLLNECGFHKDVIESQLSHQERNKSRASYNHAQYLPERVAMMQAWSDLVDSLAAGNNVVPLRKRA